MLVNQSGKSCDLNVTNYSYTNKRWYYCSLLLSVDSSDASDNVACFRCAGNCSHGDERSNLRNSCVSSTGSHTTRFNSSSYRT